MRELALATIDNGGDLARWSEESPRDVGKRRAALAAARAQIAGEQPPRKRIKPPPREYCKLGAGDVLSFDRVGGPVLLRVVRVDSDRDGESPLLEELAYTGPKVPTAAEIDKLPARRVPRGLRGMYQNLRFFALNDTRTKGWEEAGFRKVSTTSARSGDELLAHTGIHTFWSGLATIFLEGGHAVE